MSEREYYTNLPYVNYCKAKGYEEKNENLASMFRFAAYRIHQSLVTKPLSIREFWPLSSDKISKDTLVVSADMLASIKRAHNLK